jgi:hypothetical protein
MIDEKMARRLSVAGCAHFCANGDLEKVARAVVAQDACDPTEARAFVEEHVAHIERLAHQAAIHAALMRFTCR